MRIRSGWVVPAVLAGIVAAYLAGRPLGARLSGNGGAAADVGAAEAGPTPQEAQAAAPAALPLPGTPLKSVFAQLQARAAAGDVAAATRLYRDLRLCQQLERLDWVFSRVDDALLDSEVDAADLRAMQDYRVQLDAVEQREQAIGKYHRLCDGLDPEMSAARLPSLQRAAQLGEPLARACYLQRGPEYDRSGLIRHPEWLAAYRGNVESMIGAGLEAGDWRVVDVVRSAYEPGADGMLAAALGSDPVMHYRYLRLYALGLGRNPGVEVQGQLAASADRLTPEQRLDADMWARTQYQRRFTASDLASSAPSGWDPCSFPYEPM